VNYVVGKKGKFIIARHHIKLSLISIYIERERTTNTDKKIKKLNRK